MWRFTVGARYARTAGRLGQFVGSQIAGITLALLMMQHSSARGRSLQSD
jgi:hypothetical protein